MLKRLNNVKKLIDYESCNATDRSSSVYMILMVLVRQITFELRGLWHLRAGHKNGVSWNRSSHDVLEVRNRI